MIDPPRERVVSDLAVGGRDVVVEAAGSGIRQWIHAGDVQTDRTDPIGWDDVVRELIPDDACPTLRKSARRKGVLAHRLLVDA